MFRLKLDTVWIGHGWKGVGRDAPIIRTTLGNVSWCTWGGDLVMVSRHTENGVESFFIDVRSVNLNALFPHPEQKEKVSSEDLHIKLAAFIAQDIGPRLEAHMNKVLLGE